MQKLREMDFGEVEKIVDDTNKKKKKTFEDGSFGGDGDVPGGEKFKSGGGEGRNRATTEAEEEGRRDTNGEEDPSITLQMFLDHIPIGAIPGINNSSSSVLELKRDDCLGDAIRVLSEKNVFGAPIADTPLDVEDSVDHHLRLSDRYIGFIDFNRMLLWSLEEYEKKGSRTKGDSCDDFFSMLEQNPLISHTKICELAMSFLWDSFFPVHLDETLFHVLLLLSKHHIQVVPVTEKSSNKITGFVTQNAVIQLLLQSDGLEWFNSIADKPLSDFRFENGDRPIFIYEDESILDAMHMLRENRIVAVAVVQRGTRKITGCVRSNDLHLLLDNEDIFCNRRTLSVGKFVQMDGQNKDLDPNIQREIGAFISAGNLTLRNKFLPRMDSPVTNKRSDSLKEAMKNLAASKCNFCFLVDDLKQVQGMLTLRDMIIQFAPPSIDSTINGGCFFESALQQTGCRIEGETMVCDR